MVNFKSTCLVQILFVLVGHCALFQTNSAAELTTRSQDEEETERNQASPQKLSTKSIPNAIRLNDKVISGGLPENEKAFEELQALGIKTIISVDGQTPDVDTARRFGMSYVHLPHGYDGISDTRIVELAKAVQDLPGPIYIHCHHGKHRSPAAATVACVASGMLEPGSGEEVLKLAGTSAHYRGLFKVVRDVTPIDADVLKKLEVDFKSIEAIPPLAEAMVDLEHTFAQIGAIEAAGWSTPENHPDLVATHESLILQEHFTEMLRSDDAKELGESFVEMLRESERDSKQLHQILSVHEGETLSKKLQSDLSVVRKRIQDNCKACHIQFRDNR